MNNPKQPKVTWTTLNNQNDLNILKNKNILKQLERNWKQRNCTVNQLEQLNTTYRNETEPK